MRKMVGIEQSTFDDLAKMAIPFEDDADSVIVRLIKIAKKNGQPRLANRPRTKVKYKGDRNKRPATRPLGIGVRIIELIKEGWNNKRIYKAIKKEFPESKIKGPASVIWYRSRPQTKSPRRAATRPGIITRKTHPDKLSKFVRPLYRNMKYWEAAQKAFISKGRQRLGVLSLVNMIFEFPPDAQKTNRINRAVRSMTVALRQYGLPDAKRIFNEPTADVFELRLTK